MQFDILIRGGTIYSGHMHALGDVGICDGKIAAVGNLGAADAAEIIDATNLAVLPGLIDTQVHFREPGLEQKEDIQTGTQSAALGGVTTVLEMPNTSPPTTSAEALADKLRRARSRAWCNIGFFVGASPENVEELRTLERAPGTPGIKIFMGSSTGSLLVPDDKTLLGVLREGSKVCPVHAEDYYRLEARKALLSEHPSPAEHPYLRDPECARLATERLIRLCDQTGRPVHILHISTLDEIPLIESAQRRNLPVTAEVTPQHLYFAAPDCYERLGTLAQMNPPLRSQEHRQALRHALKRGVFKVIGSDHAPHTLEEKQRPYPNSPSGMPGVQTSLSVLVTLGAAEALLSVQDIVRLMCENPAELYQIENKGCIRVGFDADIAVVDLNAERVLQRSWIASKCGWSPYEGETLKGWTVHTIVNGRFAVRDGALAQYPPGTIPQFGQVSD
jgi:dihydroorotase